MGETRVDLLHLLEDLRDAYTGSLEETILTEIVANALDSGATTIRITAVPAERLLVVIDNGSGMKRRDLARYHDVASSTKTRGQGIGFAGVGIKLGLLMCEEVVTETSRGASHVASRWHLASRHRAPWKWVPPPGRTGDRGTAVALLLNNALSPLLDAGYVDVTVRRHYRPLFEPRFAAILAPHYPRGVTFEIAGRAIERNAAPYGEVAPLEVRVGRRRKPSAIGYLALARETLPEDARGVAVSTLGKVIKHGWDWLGVTPVAPDRIAGLIEVPELAGCLTLNKADFIRTGPRGATYLAYRKAIQEVSRQLSAWGHVRDATEDTRRRVAGPVERDLERVLVELADDFPLLASLVERREGGQRRLPIGGPGPITDARSLIAAAVGNAAAGRSAATATAADEGDSSAAPGGDVEPVPRPRPPATIGLPAPRGVRRPARYGLSIQFESRADDPELGRLVESTVWVNDAHPAYRRAHVTRSEGYHLALSVAMALAALAVEPHQERAFVTAFMERWGRAGTTGDRPQRSLL